MTLDVYKRQVLSFILVITVYGRMFRIYLYTAISPIPLAAFAGEPTQPIGISFLKSYTSGCLEGCLLYTSVPRDRRRTNGGEAM